MKTTKSFVLILMTAASLYGCGAGGGGESNTPSPQGDTTYNINGAVQKGPFVIGTTITIQELDKNLTPTGKTYSTQTTDDLGKFALQSKLSSPYAEIIASGYYFDEVTGALSTAPLTLRTLTDLSHGVNVNVNILTTLEKKRLVYLIGTGKSFVDAKTQAEGEILNIFNIKDNLSYFEEMDISIQGNNNAILLAISALLNKMAVSKAANTGTIVAELSQLIETVALDIESDGVLDNAVHKSAIIQNSRNLHLALVKQNLVQRYSALGVSITVPPFEDYIDSDGDGTLNKADISPKRIISDLQQIQNIQTHSNTAMAQGIKVVNGNIFWQEYNCSFPCSGTGSSALKKAPSTGGTPQTLVADTGTSPGVIAASLTDVYFVNNRWSQTETPSIRKVSVNGGTVGTLASNLQWANTLMIDSTNAYWWDIELGGTCITRPYSGFIRKVPLTGGSVTTLLSGLPNDLNSRYEIVTDGANLFWADSDGIKKIQISGGTVTVLSSVPKIASGSCTDSSGSASYYSHPVLGIATDGTFVYWLEQNTQQQPYFTQLKKVPVSGGTATNITGTDLTVSINVDNVAHMVIDSLNAYFFAQRSGDTDLQLIKAPLDGSPYTVLPTVSSNVTGSPSAIALDNTHVYWSTSKGGVWKAEK